MERMRETVKRPLGLSRLSVKVAIPIAGIMVLLIAVSFAILMLNRRSNTEMAGLTAARALADQVATLRTFYTDQVVPRAKAAGMNVNYDFDRPGVEKTLPLPATLVHVLGRHIAEEHEGMKVRLYSDFPFAHRTPEETKLDDFEQNALKALREHPEGEVYRVEMVDRRLSLRYAKADRMRAACVSCHNEHPENPARGKRVWKEGDVRGIVEVVVPVEDIDRRMGAGMMQVGGALVVLIGVLLALTFYTIQRQVVRPILGMQGTLVRVGEGDLSNKVDDRALDEVGRIAGSLNLAIEKMRTSLGRIKEASIGMSSAAEELATLSEQMSGNAAKTSSEVTVVSAASEEVSKNVQTVSTSTQSMNSSIKEIASSATEAARTAGAAVKIAEAMKSTVSRLSTSSAEIGDVVTVISAIASQTNLLALNATIEAARAGEAGRSFAVVANEVKELARETGKSTLDISKKIEAIQVDAHDAVEAIGQITGVIGQISSLQNSIATAVEEQTSMSAEISRNVTQAAKGTTEIAGSVARVTEVAQNAAVGASEFRKAAQGLASMALELQKLVAQFKLA